MSDELAASPGRFRTLTGAPAKLLRTFVDHRARCWDHCGRWKFITISRSLFSSSSILSLFLALSLCAGFFSRSKPIRNRSGDHVPWYDWFLALGGDGDRTLRHYPISNDRLPARHSLARPLDLRRTRAHPGYRSYAPRCRRHARLARPRRHSLHQVRRILCRGFFTPRVTVVGAHRELSISGLQRHVGLAPRRRRRRRRRVHSFRPSAVRRRRR